MKKRKLLAQLIVLAGVAFAGSFNPSAVSAGDASCDSCGSVAECVCDCISWYARGEALFLTRDAPERLDLIQDDYLPGTPPVLSTRSGDFSFEPGFRVTLGRQLGPRAIEASYFGLYNWNSFAEVDSADPDLDSLMTADSFYPMTSPFVYIGRDFDGAAYFAETEVHNVELNLRRQYNSVFTLLAGFRYIHVGDSFEILTGEFYEPDSNFQYEGIRGYDTDTNSDLFGFQLGGQLNYNVGADLCVELKGKAGLHLGRYGQKQIIYAYSDIDDPFAGYSYEGDVFFTASDHAWGMASTVDVGATAVYQFTDNVNLRIGYEVMSWSGLALAPEQLNDSVDGTETHRDGIIVLSGATVGLDVTY